MVFIKYYSFCKKNKELKVHLKEIVNMEG